MWNFKIYDTISGEYVGPMKPESNSMGRALNEGRSGTSMWVPPAKLRQETLTELCTPWSRTLVKFWNDTPKFAHPFMWREWDDDDGTMSLGHSDIWSILAKRSTFGVDGYGNTELSHLKMEGFSLNAMVPWLIWAGTEGPTANFELPIWLPEGKLTFALINGLPHAGPHSRTIWDYDVMFVDEAIAEVVEMPGGPNVDFVPQIVDNKLRLLLKVGDVSAGESDWQMNAPKRGLTGVKIREDGIPMANVNYAIGVGSERSMLVRTARSEPVGVPALERAENYKAIRDDAQLLEHAKADLTLRANPTKQISASMVATEGPTIEKIDNGHRMHLYFEGHRTQPDGWQHQRVVSFDTDLTHTIKLETQEVAV